MRASKKRLLALVQAAPRVTHARSWFDDLTAPQQAELKELKTAYRTGKLPGRSLNWLRTFTNEQLGLAVKKSAFLDWVRRDS